MIPQNHPSFRTRQSPRDNAPCPVVSQSPTTDWSYVETNLANINQYEFTPLSQWFPINSLVKSSYIYIDPVTVNHATVNPQFFRFPPMVSPLFGVSESPAK